jgi:hypothetical protein
VYEYTTNTHTRCRVVSVCRLLPKRAPGVTRLCIVREDGGTIDMNIVYRSTVRDFEKFCALGRRYQLYAKWGAMQDWYQIPDCVDAMAISYYKSIPIGMAMLMSGGHGTFGVRFGVFVRSYMRRQGIGGRLLSLVRKRSGQNFMVAKYDDQQTGFFDSKNVRGYRELIFSR